MGKGEELIIFPRVVPATNHVGIHRPCRVSPGGPTWAHVLRYEKAIPGRGRGWLGRCQQPGKKSLIGTEDRTDFSCWACVDVSSRLNKCCFVGPRSSMGRNSAGEWAHIHGNKAFCLNSPSWKAGAHHLTTICLTEGLRKCGFPQGRASKITFIPGIEPRGNS